MQKPLAEIQHPVLLTLLEWWDKKRGAAAMPNRADLDPADLVGILPNVFLVEVLNRTPRHFRFRLCGTQIDAEFDIPMVGYDLMELPIATLAKQLIWEQYQSAVAVGSPSYGEHRYRVADRRQIHYRRLVVPLTTDGVHVSHLFGALVFLESYALKVANHDAG